MCGIFGLITNEKNNDTKQIKSAIDELFRLSETRGKEASGIAVNDYEKIMVLKQPVAASKLIKMKEYRGIFDSLIRLEKNTNKSVPKLPLAIIGHARLVTSGDMSINDNNQPVIKDGVVCVHNGIIVNDNDIWIQFPRLQRNNEVDTEVIGSLFHKLITDTDSLVTATVKTYEVIKGSASIALLFNNLKYALLATNTGSLYIGQGRGIIVFASELFILKKLLRKFNFDNRINRAELFQLKQKQGYIIQLENLKTKKFNFNEIGKKDENKIEGLPALKILDISPRVEKKDYSMINLTESKSVFKKYHPDVESINSIKRCTKCILPETMPFIEFDDNGVCNYCRYYKRLEFKGKTHLEQTISNYRDKSGKSDVLISFSGGRDSSYGLHYLKRELGMNPIAYSYDWGMITDLGRRNQARMCGQLGVEHILVSADIRRKRHFIRKNVLAWLKKPDLGTVPLFMAGDKQYFYYAHKLAKLNNIDLLVMCENLYEKTDFKSGFCGVKPNLEEKSVYNLTVFSKLILAGYYARQYLMNPAYLNASLLDTIGAYISYYVMPHSFMNLFHYIQWDEGEVMKTLIDEYDWEVAPDTISTWRIGDGTTSFYNYIYYTVAGFTENDTFRSNQIREGMITREEALKHVATENQPREELIKWYCDTIGIDLERTIKIINNIPKLR